MTKETQSQSKLVNSLSTHNSQAGYVRLMDRLDLVQQVREMCLSGLSRADICLALGLRYEVVRKMTTGMDSAPRRSRSKKDCMDLSVPSPTEAIPGTAAKIEVLRSRLESSEELHHPEDAKLPLAGGSLDIDDDESEAELSAMADRWCEKIIAGAVCA